MEKTNDLLLSTYYTYKRIMTKIFNSHKQKKKDILILSSPRSGSTWLMELLSYEKHAKYIDEPLSKDIIDIKNFLPIKTWWNYLSLDDTESKIFKNYFNNDDIIRCFGSANILKNNYSYFTNRRIFKVIRANALIEFFENEFDFNIIYLIRHPISQSLSCIRRKHHCEIPEYLENKKFKKKFLTKEQIEHTKKVLKSELELEKHVTEWCLDNIAPINHIKENKKNKIFVLGYEELVLETEKILKLITDLYDFSDYEMMLKKIKNPSKVTNSSTLQTKNKIVEGDRAFLISKWREKVDKKYEKKLMQIPKLFNINSYSFGEDIPITNFLHN
jgi:hypothetical protein